MVTKKAFINGNIYTVNQNEEWVEAIFIEKNKIRYVGTNSEINAFIDENTQIIDLNKKMVLPGFIDAHTHMFLGEIMNLGIQFNASSTKQELLDTIANYVENNKNNKFIFGIGFSASIFGTHTPTAQELDKITRNKPVVLLDEGCHSMWVNSKALEIANITKETKDPIPNADYYQRDSEGNPTGWIVESLSMRPIVKHLNLLEEILQSDLKNMFELFASYGITSIFNASEFFFSANSTAPLEYLNKMAQNGKAQLRFFTSYSYNNHESLQDPIDVLCDINQQYHSDYVKMDTLKIWLDGTVEARNAALTQPYIGSSYCGDIFYSLDELQQVVNKAISKNINIHLHAIGDKTIDTALEVYKQAKEKFPYTKSTYTIAHNEVFNKNTISHFASSDAIANTTPIWHVATEGSRQALGQERYQNMYRFNSLIQQGVLTTFGSDYPTGLGKLAMNVFYNIQAGHTRIFPKEIEALPTKEECLSIKDLIKGYTINAAKQVLMHDKIGSIEQGKYADFIVLENNLFEQNPEDIHKNEVLLTVFDGKIIYNKTH